VGAFHRNACRVGNYRGRRHGRFRRGRVALHGLLPRMFPIVGVRRSQVGGRRLDERGERARDGGRKRVGGMLVVRRLEQDLLRGRGVVLRVVDTFYVWIAIDRGNGETLEGTKYGLKGVMGLSS